MIKLPALAVAWLFAAPLPLQAAEVLPKLRKDQGYAATRQALIAAGWKPVTLPGADSCEPGDERCQGRAEMLACAGTGMAQCVFTWQRNATIIDVVTIGERPVFSKASCRSGCR
ncbi:MAG: hypothetical protein DCF30_10710 [Hyphomicrobiales bacterium]|nr:MAG: hypothetical protein DCF30_10710 [Hyphomicrobiales bacterium]